jgi:hypothetical protein
MQPRVVLLDAVLGLYRTKNVIFDLSHTIVKKELVSYLLKGDKRLNDMENESLFDMVQRFIGASKIFLKLGKIRYGLAAPGGEWDVRIVGGDSTLVYLYCFSCIYFIFSFVY